MIVAETKDVALIKSVLCHPDIYDVINDDNSGPAEEFEPPLTSKYIAGFVDGEIVGLMIYTTIKEGLECHIQVLPEFRKQHARKFARMAIEFGEAKNSTIYSEIPICYPNVIDFAKEFGFKQIGIIKNDCTRDGIKYDVVKMRKAIGG